MAFFRGRGHSALSKLYGLSSLPGDGRVPDRSNEQLQAGRRELPASYSHFATLARIINSGSQVVAFKEKQ
jgi:hypothetical protein